LLNYESDRLSGETTHIRRFLRGKDRPIIFDVGANEGHWSAVVHAAAPCAIVHAFEPNNHLAERAARLNPGATVNCLALGSETGVVTLYDYADVDGSSHASVVPGVIDRIHGGNVRGSTVPVVTIDRYCEERAIARIDYLKIDVEGYEYEVLRGAKRMIARGIDVIQFEFNEMNVMSRRFLSDFVDLLGPRYDLHRLLPDGGLMRLSDAAVWHREQFAFQNIVAAHRTPAR
jgi:FkbM family methyltransferase